MPLYYRARQSQLKSKDGKKKWHPCLVKNGEIISTRTLGLEAAEKSSLTTGDMMNAVECLFSSMKRYLQNGYSVRLDGVGTFTLIAKSNGNGVETFEEVNASQISNLRVRFTPEYTRTSFDGTTRALLAGVKFKRWDGEGAAPTDDNSPGDGGGGWTDPNA